MFGKTLAQIERLLEWLLAVPAALVGIIHEWVRRYRLANRFPGPVTLPIFGNMFDVGFRIPDIKFFMHLLDEVIPRYRTGQFWMGPLRFIFISEPEDLQNYFQHSKNQKKPKILLKTAIPLIGNGLIADSGERWKHHRKVIEPTFHTDLLNIFLETFNKEADKLVETLKEHAHGRPFDLTSLIQQLAFNIICETVIGVPAENVCHDYPILKHSMEQIQEIIGYRSLRIWLLPDVLFNLSPTGRRNNKCYKEVRGFVHKIIQQRKMLLKLSLEGKKEKPRFRLIDAMLRQKLKGSPITDEDIAHEVQTALTAGLDTVNLLVQFTLYNLAKHPDVQEKVFQEVQRIFDGKSKEVTIATLQQLVYLEQVVKEVLRLNSPVWGIFRCTGADTPLVKSDLVIPAGSYVAFGLKSIHMDPKSYPDPHKFDPDRWTPENVAKRHPYSFLPFSAGQRICVGKRFAMMEALTVLSKVALNYEVLPDPTYKPVYVWGLSAAIKGCLRIKAVKRQRIS